MRWILLLALLLLASAFIWSLVDDQPAACKKITGPQALPWLQGCQDAQ
jgi:hypothetical protein